MELNELGKLLGERNKSGNGYQIHLNSGNIDTSCGKSMDVEFSDLYFTSCKILRDKHTLVFCNDDKQPVSFDEEINQPLYKGCDILIRGRIRPERKYYVTKIICFFQERNRFVNCSDPGASFYVLGQTG